MPNTGQLIPWLEKITENRWYSNFGPLVDEFEHKIAELIPYKPELMPLCISTASGTLALETALMLHGIGVGKRVLTPVFGFPAAAQAVLKLGAQPVFAAVDCTTWALDPLMARSIVESNAIDAIIPVSNFGYALPAEDWSVFAEQTGIPVILDCAAALGNQVLAKHISVIFSLHATKAFGVGEGGLLATASKELLEKFRRGTNFGFDSRVAVVSGTNAKMSEWHAAVGLAQMLRWPVIVHARRKIRDWYIEALPRQLIVHPDAHNVFVPAYMPIRFTTSQAAINAQNYLAAQGIESRRWFYPLLNAHPAFVSATLPQITKARLQECDACMGSILCLPFYTRLTENDVQQICLHLRNYLHD